MGCCRVLLNSFPKKRDIALISLTTSNLSGGATAKDLVEHHLHSKWMHFHFLAFDSFDLLKYKNLWLVKDWTLKPSNFDFWKETLSSFDQHDWNCNPLKPFFVSWVPFSSYFGKGVQVASWGSMWSGFMWRSQAQGPIVHWWTRPSCKEGAGFVAPVGLPAH